MKYNTIYAFGENNESGIRSRQVPVLRGLISIVLSVINSGPNNYYGIDRIPVCTGSGMYRLHCTSMIFVMCLWFQYQHWRTYQSRLKSKIMSLNGERCGWTWSRGFTTIPISAKLWTTTCGTGRQTQTWWVLHTCNERNLSTDSNLVRKWCTAHVTAILVRPVLNNKWWPYIISHVNIRS